MKTVVVVGSGASGVHFSLAALEKGWNVTMVDLGRRGHEPVLPEMGFEDLKTQLDDPVSYFLGRNFDSVLLPSSKGEYYGFPPNKKYVFEIPDREQIEVSGFEPLRSYAEGGLAETWTGGSYSLRDSDLTGFPISREDLAPHFAGVANEIGIAGEYDDTSRYFPSDHYLRKPVEIDAHGEYLLKRYEKARRKINKLDRAVIGRSHTAVLSSDHEDRKGCTLSGRCLWGCPVKALYTPSVTLSKLKKHDRFTYLDGRLANWLEIDDAGKAVALDVTNAATGDNERIEAQRFVLAGGTLSSSRIFLDTWRLWKGESPRLGGLMDNRQIIMPFVTLAMLGKRCETRNYQYHQLMMALAGKSEEEMIHCQVTTLKSAQYHAIIQSAPMDLLGAMNLFRLTRTSLGLVNINLHDTPRDDSYVTIKPGNSGEVSKLSVVYVPEENEAEKIRIAKKRVKRVLRRLGCIVPPGMTRLRPMGASVHYAGTLPMSADRRPLAVDKECRSYDIENLFIADGSTFCRLPAKNLTFTLMANARRIGMSAF